MRKSSLALPFSPVFFKYPLRWLALPAAASPSRCSSSSAFKTRSASAFFSSSNRPSLEKTCLGSRPESSSSSMPFLIAIARLLRLHYGPAHKIPDSPERQGARAAERRAPAQGATQLHGSRQPRAAHQGRLYPGLQPAGGRRRGGPDHRRPHPD